MGNYKTQITCAVQKVSSRRMWIIRNSHLTIKGNSRGDVHLTVPLSVLSFIRFPTSTNFKKYS